MLHRVRHQLAEQLSCDQLQSDAHPLGERAVSAELLADPVIGLAISVAILFVLKSAGRDIYRRLMDSVDPDLVDQVEVVLAGVPGVEAVQHVRVRWLGHELRAEVEIVSDCDLTLAVAHDIAEEAHHRLLHGVPRLSRAVIHTSPCNHDGLEHHRRTAHHFVGRA